MPGERGLILVVEDGREAAEFMATLLEMEGFSVVSCPDAKSARLAFSTRKPVAALLDWVLPDAPGSELCRELRMQDDALTIIFVSARADETSVARALDAGADDYVTKPVRGGELVARLEAHLRRVAALRREQAPEARPTPRKFSFGAVEVDLGARKVLSGGKPVKLSPLEFRLLEYLVRNAGLALSRDQILSAVYGIDAEIGTDRVDLLVRRLRTKLGDQPGAGERIVAQAGYGYLLEK